MDETFAVGDATYAAEHVIVIADRKTLTRDGTIMIIGDEFAVLLPGDGPVEDRFALAVHVDHVEVTGRPWYAFGQAVNLRIEGRRWQVQPHSIAHGGGLATPKKMRRAREAAIAFVSALTETRRAASSPAGP